jgi:hypothetical protein
MFSQPDSVITEITSMSEYFGRMGKHLKFQLGNLKFDMLDFSTIMISSKYSLGIGKQGEP